jgi:hypothetical protein
MRVRALGLTLGLFALATTACGGTEIDADKAESLIKENIGGPPPKTVECPDHVKAHKGETFRCDLTYEHGVPPAIVTVHIEDDDGRIRVGPGDLRFQR